MRACMGWISPIQIVDASLPYARWLVVRTLLWRLHGECLWQLQLRDREFLLIP